MKAADYIPPPHPFEAFSRLRYAELEPEPLAAKGSCGCHAQNSAQTGALSFEAWVRQYPLTAVAIAFLLGFSLRTAGK